MSFADLSAIQKETALLISPLVTAWKIFAERSVRK